MGYKSVYICEECGAEEVADTYTIHSLPHGWWMLGKKDLVAFSFCTMGCLETWLPKTLYTEGG